MLVGAFWLISPTMGITSVLEGELLPRASTVQKIVVASRVFPDVVEMRTEPLENHRCLSRYILKRQHVNTTINLLCDGSPGGGIRDLR